jgi:hypothetical protein
LTCHSCYRWIIIPFLFSFRATNGVVGKVDIVNNDANVEVTKKKRKKRSKKKKTVVQDDDDSDDDEEEETVVETVQTTESKPPQTTLGDENSLHH